MGWTVRWWVHIWYGGLGTGHGDADRPRARAVHVDTVAELRALIEQLRADPQVRRYTHGQFDHLDDTEREPEHCPACGEWWPRLTAIEAPARGWTGCAGCPGHGTTLCHACQVLTVWPPAGPDCAPVARPTLRHPPQHPAWAPRKGRGW